MKQTEINNAVAKLLMGRGFQRTASLAARFGCTKGSVVEAFSVAQAAYPQANFTRVYGASGGMGRV